MNAKQKEDESLMPPNMQINGLFFFFFFAALLMFNFSLAVELGQST